MWPSNHRPDKDKRSQRLAAFGVVLDMISRDTRTLHSLAQPLIVCYNMLYYAPFTEASIEDSRFSSRGAGMHRQGPVSDLSVDVVPDVRQVAYSVYKDNIDVFLAATGTRKSVGVHSGGIDVPFIHHTFPLVYPKTIVTLKLKKDNLDKAVAVLKAGCTEMTQVEGITKHPNCYAMVEPKIDVIRKIAPASRNSPIVGGACGVESTLALCHCLHSRRAVHANEYVSCVLCRRSGIDAHSSRFVPEALRTNRTSD